MGLLDNAFNTSNTLANQRQRVATAASERQGSGSVYLAAQGGERMKQGTRSMLGIADPAIEQQELLQGILQKHSNMKTAEDMMLAANDLQNAGFTEYAQKMIENATNKMMKEKKAAKFCRLFLAQEKKRKKIKDYNRADVRLLYTLSISCSISTTDKLITKNGWTLEVGHQFEKEIGYK